MSAYELGIFGDPTLADREALKGTINRMIGEFGLTSGSDVIIFDAAAFGTRNKHAAFAALYFGGQNQADLHAVREILAASLPIIPVVRSTGNPDLDVPGPLKFANCHRLRDDDPQMLGAATALLECVGLLRRQRRVFVSYRRVESTKAAIQLHDLLSSRGFDVFLDTHEIRPGQTLDDVIWHRLCDSDVLVMLDTPTYFTSKWTTHEIGRARAKEVHVLRVIWPAHTPSRHTDLAETIPLQGSDLLGKDGPLEENVANKIVLAVESLRSRSIASRYMSITGRLRVEVERIGGQIEGIGAHRAIAVRLESGKKLWAYPVVGIPTAELMYDVAERARQADHREVPVLVYDHIGISDHWSAHLKWLDDNIKTVKTLKVSEAAWNLATWEAAA